MTIDIFDEIKTLGRVILKQISIAQLVRNITNRLTDEFYDISCWTDASNYKLSLFITASIFCQAFFLS